MSRPPHILAADPPSSQKKAPSPCSLPSPAPSPSTTSGNLAGDGDGNNAKILLDPRSKLTADIFGALTKSLAQRAERLGEETARDEEELARLCELLGLKEDAENPSGMNDANAAHAPRLNVNINGGLRGVAQVSLAADLLGEAIRRNKREGEAIVRETLELRRMTDRVVGSDKKLAAILGQLKL